MELSAGSHGLPGRGRGSGISAARHWVSHPTGGWNCAAAVVFSRGPRNLPDRGRVPGNGRSGDRDADAKEAENLLSPRAQHAQARADDVCTWGRGGRREPPADARGERRVPRMGLLSMLRRPSTSSRRRPCAGGRSGSRRLARSKRRTAPTAARRAPCSSGSAATRCSTRSRSTATAPFN